MTEATDALQSTVSTASTTRNRLHALPLAIYALLLIGLWGFLTALSVHVTSGNSDGATVVLEGQSMAHGNLLLHGWSLSLDSFWSIDAVFYMLATLVSGVHASLLHVVPALIAMCVVGLGIAIARNGFQKQMGYVAAAVVVLIIGFPSPALSTFYLAGPYHVGTTLFCLAAIYLLRGEHFDRSFVVGVIFLTAGLLGDLQSFTLGVVPIAVAALVAMLRRWRLRAGLSAFIGAALSVGLAGLIRELAKAIGTFDLVQANPAAGWSTAFSNIPQALRYEANLLGVGNNPFSSAATPLALTVVHFVAVVLIAAAVLYYLAQLLRGAVAGVASADTNDRGWRIEDMLVVAFFADLFTYAYLATTDANAQARYLTAGVVFGAILASRLVALTVLHFSELPTWVSRKRIALVAGSIIGAWCIVSSCYVLSEQAPMQPADELAQFLVAHHLTIGIGGYWNSAITTVSSGGVAHVEPVIDGPSGVIVRYQRQSDSAWYRHQPFQFLAYNTALPIDGLTRASAKATFGPLSHVYAVGTYRVIIFPHPIFVSTKGAAA